MSNLHVSALSSDGQLSSLSCTPALLPPTFVFYFRLLLFLSHYTPHLKRGEMGRVGIVGKVVVGGWMGG